VVVPTSPFLFHILFLGGKIFGKWSFVFGDFIVFCRQELWGTAGQWPRLSPSLPLSMDWHRLVLSWRIAIMHMNEYPGWTQPQTPMRQIWNSEWITSVERGHGGPTQNQMECLVVHGWCLNS
jgi:hypothetical protein